MHSLAGERGLIPVLEGGICLHHWYRLLEAGTVLPAGWPQWSADSHGIRFCQTLMVAVGWGGTVVLLRRLLVQNSTQWVSSSLMLLTLSLAGRWLVAL